MFDRRLVQYFDWGLLVLTVLLAGIGLAVLYSAVAAGSPNMGLFFRQLIWYAAGFCTMIVCFSFDYKKLDRWAFVGYAGCVVLLIMVLMFGRYIGGSRRWLGLGPVSIQPSELMKIALIVMAARYYSRVASAGGLTFRELIPPFFMAAVPFALIVKQPDLGTAMILFLVVGSMTIFIKIERRTLIGLGGAGILMAPLVWLLLKDYQKQRILTFMSPDRDPLGAGYHIIQSKIAIGSGMMSGKGFLKGTQNALSFLPEHHTDFIFSVLGEEWGFFGCAFLLLAFLLLLVWGLNVAYRCRDPFGTLLAVGVVAMLFWHAFINIGMVMGLMPVVGAPLPFISYGGSSIVTVMISMGLLMNISMRRFMFE